MISWRSSRSSSMQNGELALGAERDASRLHTGAPATAGIPLPAISMPLPATGTPSIGIAMGTAGAGDGVVVSAHHGTDFRWPSPLARGGGVGAIGPDADATGSWSGPPTPRRSNARPRRTDPPAGSFDPLVGSSLTSAWFEIGAGTYEAAGRTRYATGQELYVWAINGACRTDGSMPLDACGTTAVVGSSILRSPLRPGSGSSVMVQALPRLHTSQRLRCAPCLQTAPPPHAKQSVFRLP